jgi:hypothetical protein
MKPLLHYLNWAVHNINRLFMYVIKSYLKFGLAFIVMLVVSVPILFLDSEEAIGLWGIVLFFGSIFVAIAWMIKHEKTEEVSEHHEVEIKTWKQSAVSSGRWVLYTIFLFVTAAIIISFL